MVFGALSAIEMGDTPEAERLQARARAALGGREWAFYLPMTWSVEAVLAWHAGHLAEAVALLREMSSRLLEMETRPVAAFMLFELAECAADAGDAVAAAGAERDLQAIAEFIRLPLYEGLAAGGSTWAAVAAAEPERAVQSARAAIELLSGTGWRAHLARCHDALGRSLPVDDRAEAVAALEQAAALFEECGAGRRRERSLDALRRLGSVGRRAAAAALGPESLTRREREVARLAATGMTAKEIAQALFVGKRTVETHLASIYAKLGVDSKLQLVRRAEELGLS
jgi:DNA-binding CsgD family transcriptional regulator